MFKRVVLASAIAAGVLIGFAGNSNADDVGSIIPPTGGSCGSGRGVVVTISGRDYPVCGYVTYCSRPDIGAHVSVNSGRPTGACVDPFILT